MKWLSINTKWKIIYGSLVLFGVACLLFIGFLLDTALENQQGKLPENPTINITVTELVVDEALKAELEATKSQLRATEQDLSILLLKQQKMAVELNQALTQLAQLRANQQPDLAVRYVELNTKYQRQYGELLELKAVYKTLLADYEELVRVHALCGEGEK